MYTQSFFFLPGLNQERTFFLSKASFPMCFRFHFYQTLVPLYLVLQLTFKHTLVFLTVKINLIPTFPSNNYKNTDNHNSHIYLSLSIYQTFSKTFLLLICSGEGTGVCCHTQLWIFFHSCQRKQSQQKGVLSIEMSLCH